MEPSQISETSQNYYYKQPITYHGGKTEILERYSTDQYTDWALEFMKSHEKKEKPWYLWLCIGAVHSPYRPAQRHLKEYAGVDIDTPKDIFPPRPGKPDWAQKIQQWEKDANGKPVAAGKSFNDWVRQYHQGVNAIDENIKRLIDYLDQTGQRKNTFVIFTSRSGPHLGQHRFPRNQGCRLRCQHPLTPGLLHAWQDSPGQDLQDTRGRRRYRASIFAFAGEKLPWAMHGRDLTPLIKNPEKGWEHPAFLVATGQTYGSATSRFPRAMAPCTTRCRGGLCCAMSAISMCVRLLRIWKSYTTSKKIPMNWTTSPSRRSIRHT